MPEIIKHDRKSEPDTLIALARLAPSIIRVGRFRPGGVGGYACAYVLRYLGHRGGAAEYVTHCAAVVDDAGDELSVAYYWGHYFSDYEKAVADLAER